MLRSRMRRSSSDISLGAGLGRAHLAQNARGNPGQLVDIVLILEEKSECRKHDLEILSLGSEVMQRLGPIQSFRDSGKLVQILPSHGLDKAHDLTQELV